MSYHELSATERVTIQIGPVSYTHLAVYKRQDHLSAACLLYTSSGV
nr:hypothetical protein [Pseudomonas sp. HS-2]